MLECMDGNMYDINYNRFINSFIANKRIEVKLTQHMMCAMYLCTMLFILRVKRSDMRN
jgi:hypothetical protein